MKKIILIGGGSHCKSAIDVIEQEGKFKIMGIIDNAELPGSKVLGYSVIGSDSSLKTFSKKYDYALITVGQIKSPLIRMKLFSLAKEAGFSFPTVISPYAYVSKHSIINAGTIVMHNAIVNANVSIGENCIINTKALVEHDCLIYKHCHISTNAIINGGVTIQEGSFIGSNSTIKQLVKIKKRSFIKAGCIVT